jgi:hypothetical protein
VPIRTAAINLVLVLFSPLCVGAQQPAQNGPGSEKPVPLAEQSEAFDANGSVALAGRLRTVALNGTPDAAVQNVRLVIENRSQSFYSYTTGWATFYDAQGVRCGTGMFKLDALAMGESAETDTPGLHITCAPASWRIVATSLLTRTTDAAKMKEPAPTEQAEKVRQRSRSAGNERARTGADSLPPLRININGEEHPIQLNHPIKIKVGEKDVSITVAAAP